MLMTFLPESFFCFCHIVKEEMLNNISWIDADTCNITLARCLVFLGLFAVSVLFSWVYSQKRKEVKTKGNKYSIMVEYGDLLKKENCQRAINFDECFTTKVGPSPADIRKIPSVDSI